ncbi:Armadillo-like helical, partial [Cynara cardunculus var. scolymus]
INAAFDDEVPSVRSAACRAIGVIACFPQVFKSVEILCKFINAAEVNSHHSLVSVRIAASWALANLCDSLRHFVDRFTSTGSSGDLMDCSRMVSLLIDCSLRLTRDGDKIKANAVRALGNLSRFVPCSSHGHGMQEYNTSFHIDTEHAGKSPNHVSAETERCLVSTSFLQRTWEDSRWLERMVQAFLSCVTTGNVKLSFYDYYGESYSDVVQGVEHTLENLGTDQMFAPSSFKYRVALEKQLTSTMLHLLGLASVTHRHHSVHDFLIKKASFLEEWLRSLCLSLVNQFEAEHDSTWYQKKEVINRAIQSLVKVYESQNHQAMAQRFEKLVNKLV